MRKKKGPHKASPQAVLSNTTHSKTVLVALPMDTCPKYEGCSAPLCPLDLEWRKRSMLKSERVCFYLTEYSKQAARPILQGVLPGELYQAIAKAYPAIIAVSGPTRRALRRSSKTGPRVGRLPGRAAA